MNETITSLVKTAGAIGGIGALCGGALALAAKFLSVEEDPRIEATIEILPGANCGGCGFAGCADYAKAIIVDGTAINLCSAGGSEVLAKLAALTGAEATEVEKKVAKVLCAGNAENAPKKSEYNGIADCKAAAATNGGDKICSYGCLGYGSCSRVCPVGAIEINNSLAYIHADICIGCGACIKTCPRNIIKMVPASRTIHVLCSSKDKGPVVKKACSVGCIGCTLCTKSVEDEEIKMDKFLAVVDYSKELINEEPIKKCPMKCIVKD